jgi:hypothetical protein
MARQVSADLDFGVRRASVPGLEPGRGPHITVPAPGRPGPQITVPWPGLWQGPQITVPLPGKSRPQITLPWPGPWHGPLITVPWPKPKAQVDAAREGPGVPDPGDITPGSTPQDVLNKLPPSIRNNGWPTRTGNGIRFADPSRPGDQVRIMPGNPRAPDPLHQGPYVEISKNGRETRIPLRGNPVL